MPNLFAMLPEERRAVGHTGTVCRWRTASGRFRPAIDLEGAGVRRVYRFAGAAAVAVVLSVSLADSNLAAGSTSPGAASGVAWGRCSDPLLRQDGAQCGYVSVPLNYSDPTGAGVRIAVSRIRHTGRDYQGVVLVNPGGPGEPGLDWGDYLRTALLGEGFAAAARDYDWMVSTLEGWARAGRRSAVFPTTSRLAGLSTCRVQRRCLTRGCDVRQRTRAPVRRAVPFWRCCCGT